MIKKSILVVTALLLILAMGLSACQSGTTTTTGTTGTTKPAETTGSGETTTDGGADVPAFEDIEFPDGLPVKPPMAESGWYTYDNMDTKYSLSILTHNYGEPPLPADEDPINQWLRNKFNLEIEFEAINHADLETTLSTRFASGDQPDLFFAVTRDLAFQLSDQGLLVDAKGIYPYMPQTTRFATKNMIAWSTNPNNGELPFITKYGIQDGVWGFAIRKDWLQKFGMSEPKTREELIAYAKACVTEDPDGNGQADTYFMSGAGGGNGWGMLGGFWTMFGNPVTRVEDGQLVHTMFNDTRKEFLMFLNELYTANVLAPDWYTIDWEKNKSYTMNDKLGMVWYPAGALYAEYSVGAKNKSMESLDVWHYWKEAPIEGGKYDPTGNPGYTWSFSKKGFAEEGKLLRVAHMLDTMVIGGENFFHTIQGGTNEIFEAMGIELEGRRETVYTPEGTFYLKNDQVFPWIAPGPYSPLGPWQHFGLSVIWQRSAPRDDDEYEKKYAELTNAYNDVILAYERWNNDALKITIPGDLAPNLNDFANAQELAFVTNKRSFSEWEAYQAEWLDKGGRAIIEATAEYLGVPTPDYAK